MGLQRVRHDLVTEQQMKGERENNTIIAGDVSISLSTTDRLYWEKNQEGNIGFELYLTPLKISWDSLVAQMVKHLPAMQKTWVWSLVRKIPWRRSSMDGGARWATVHGVAKSQTWMNDFTYLLRPMDLVGICITFYSTAEYTLLKPTWNILLERLYDRSQNKS